ncbi:MAG: amino acid adenylation domain-containing protein [Planctomycetes bacterium]|nr:amino acid adenylation domain-containing protein [Planctomycetota bacterium]
MVEARAVLTGLFVASAAKHAERIAIDVPPAGAGRPRVCVTFAQLARMATWIAAELAPRVGDESCVVVLVPRHDPWLVASQLGVLFAGGAHACVDPSFPAAHLHHVVRDTRAAAVVTVAALADRFAGLGVPIVLVPERSDVPQRAAPAPPGPNPNRLAYVIYTSGTTGRPKGVCIEHRGIVNLIREGVARFAVGPGDRIAQGSSPAYDSSVEEIWLGLASGATVVVMDDETVRLGPDLLPWLRTERITILCPPPTLLRTLGCRSPRDELPDLRLAYVGGEPLPADLAAVWGRDVWLENGYGPTECSVTVVRGRVRAGEPVTIGTPVPPHAAHVLGDDLRPVPPGEPGELCIAGPGLARGYLGLDALTAERFPTLPGLGRVYRTGDLVVQDERGELRHLGRIDAQVKVRGHRIELEAVEAVLARVDGVREVVCTVQGEEPDRDLVAHVVPVDPAAPPSFAGLAACVRAELPAIAVPTRFALLGRVPRTVGGKVDRRALPFVGVAAARDVHADDSITGCVRAAFANVLAMPASAFGDGDDFFALGGNSLRAALLVSRLRTDRRLSRIAVRDLYEAPTVAGLVLAASGPSAAAAGGAAPHVAGPAPRASLLAFTAGQAVFLLGFLGLGSTAMSLVAFDLLPWLLDSLPLGVFLLAAPWIALATAGVASLASWWLVVAAKELLIGRYVPARVPAWSGLRLRHWVVATMARTLPWSFCAGTEMLGVLLRSLGARVGKRVHVHRGVDLSGGGWDLLEIGDDATLWREVDLGLCELDAGELVIGPVRIGAGATLATRAGTGPDVDVGDGAVVAPLSFVPAGTRVPDGAVWSGVPAAPHTLAGGPLRSAPSAATSRRHSLLLLAARAALGPLAWMPLALLAWVAASWFGLDGATIAAWLRDSGPWTQPDTAMLCVVIAVIALPVALLQTALLLRWSPKIPAGTHGLWSARHAWASVRMAWLERAGTWLSGTLFWPRWLRLAGMRVGDDVEISTILDVLPEHASIGGGSFLADGVYLGVPNVRRGTVTVAATVLGERTFVGNHVVVPAGQRLPDDLLLGISTVADDACMRAGTGWFGQPPFPLPRREVIEVDRRLTHDPGPLRRANRVFWEALRFVLPGLLAAAGLAWFAIVDRVAASGGFTGRWLASVVATLGVTAALAAVVLATKWLLLGRVRPGRHGLWSCWASRWDFHYVLWQRCGRTLLQALEGTLLLPWFLRAMGMRIGRGCVLGDGFAQVVDPDMITIEDGATVHALFQAHSFEDRVLKIDRVRIGRGSTVGKGAVLLYGVDVGDGAHVMPHSVVMKHETLLPGRSYAGAPTAEAAATLPLHAAAADATAAGAASERVDAFDFVRGLAVLGMVWLHFVPEPAEGAVGVFAGLVQLSLVWLEGVPAATFLLLAGVAWAMRPRSSAWVLRRALAMAAIGVPFWRFVWPNDVLVPLALMLPLAAALQRAGRLPIAAVLVVGLAVVPFVGAAFGDVVARDLLDDGTHVANHSFGLATLRWFVFDGAYPLLPWLCLPLLGAVLAQSRDGPRLARWCALALPLVLAGHLVPAAAAMGGGDADPLLLATWQPTSLAFVAQRFGAALLVTAASAWWLRERALPRWLRPVASVGRMSFTHYLVHTCIVYAAMRHFWPQEDWPVATGVFAAVGYAAFALAMSGAWLRRVARGPAEAFLARSSGAAR